jgi:hypothetical protein
MAEHKTLELTSLIPTAFILHVGSYLLDTLEEKSNMSLLSHNPQCVQGK